MKSTKKALKALAIYVLLTVFSMVVGIEGLTFILLWMSLGLIPLFTVWIILSIFSDKLEKSVNKQVVLSQDSSKWKVASIVSTAIVLLFILVFIVLGFIYLLGNYEHVYLPILDSNVNLVFGLFIFFVTALIIMKKTQAYAPYPKLSRFAYIGAIVLFIISYFLFL